MNDRSTPRFLQGVFALEGLGLTEPFLLDPTLSYTVPPGAATQPVYFRGGNSSDELIYLTLVRDGTTMRYFPIGARGATHVSLRVVEELLSDTVIEVYAAAPEGILASVVLDVGLIEI